MFDRSTPSIKMGLCIIYPINKGMCLPELSSVKCMAIFLKIPSYFYTNLKISESYVSLNIDLGSIKVLTFLDFVDQTDHLWLIYYPNQDGLVYYLSNKQKQTCLQR